jgi:hypothetical protein
MYHIHGEEGMELLIFFILLQYIVIFYCLEKLGNAIILVIILNAVNAFVPCKELGVG